MKEVICIICRDKLVVATDDDNFAKCPECQEKWALALSVQEIMAGGMDHLLPIEGESDMDDDDG